MQIFKMFIHTGQFGHYMKPEILAQEIEYSNCTFLLQLKALSS
jgi:hypothetical protein